MNSSQILRYEKKSVLSKEEFLDFQFWMKTDGLSFATAYPDRSINNIYFDSPSFDAYSENASGTSHRSKCRLRWYGEDQFKTKKFHFEVKVKKNMLGYKITSLIPPEAIRSRSESLYQNIRPHLCDSSKIYFDQSHMPVVFNRYDRKYFTDNTGVRITVDQNLFHSSVASIDCPRSAWEKSEVFAVLEIKYDQEKETKIQHIIKNLPFALSKNSKYTNAVDFY